MAISDPVADMLTRVRNANMVLHDRVAMPSSKLKVSLAEVLKSEGYINDFSVAQNDGKPGSTLTIEMKYTEERGRTISGLRRISKPGMRIYARSTELPRVLGGLGVAVVSTSRGLMTDQEARRRRMGGEILCYVW